MSVDFAKLGNDEAAVLDACLNKPMYRVLATGDAAEELADKLLYTWLTFDSYCVGCKRSATFRRVVANKRPPPFPVSITPGGASSRVKVHTDLWQTVKAHCTRNAAHTFTFLFGPYRDGIAKVGQSPSVLDVASADLERFTGVLDDVDASELRQAVMLHSHGAAVGAFVYLRRIFERLLERHHQEYVRKFGDIADYENLPTEDRVEALKEVLPPEVVKNRKVYRVLSKGIHQLEEEECGILYDVMYPAIVEILDRDIFQAQQAKTSEELAKGVARAVEKLALDSNKSDVPQE